MANKHEDGSREKRIVLTTTVGTALGGRPSSAGVKVLNMSTQRKEFVAIAHALIGLNEAALKQATVIFDRIGIQGLSMDLSKAPFISPDFIKVRAWLTELGILFDLDFNKLKGSTAHDYAKLRDMIIEDTDLFTQPAFGMSVREMAVAAREDKEKFAEIRKRGDQRFADGSLDPLKIWEISVRLSTNAARMFASQLRDIEGVDAHAVFPFGFDSLEQDDPRITIYDVLKIEVGALPVPVEHVPWQQIIEYRNDPDTKGSFLLIRDWMNEVARGVFTLSQVEETLEYLVNRVRRSLEAHAINSTTIGLVAYVVTNPEFLQTLAGAGPDWGTRALFSVEHLKLGLLEGESTSPGSAVAYLVEMDLSFPS
jgi:hypothetical protein